METVLMKGKAVADAYKEAVINKIANAKAKGEATITLAIVIVGEDPASHVYKDRLVKMTESVGAQAKVVIMPEVTSEEEVIAKIEELNSDASITGILPMMPMPEHINNDAVGAAIATSKDVDCLSPLSAGEVFLGRSPWAPCTPRACMATLKHYGIELVGKNVVVVGRSNVVGKPVAMLLLREHATVTIAHSKTKDLATLTRKADIIVAAVGVPGFITADMVKEGVVIVDVGINATESGLVGDVDALATNKASAFTPVPGGIGVVSNMMVMDMLTRNL